MTSFLRLLLRFLAFGLPLVRLYILSTFLYYCFVVLIRLILFGRIVIGLTLHLIGLLEPVVAEDLRDCQSSLWLKLYHASDEVCGLCGEVIGDGVFTRKDQLVQIFEGWCFERHCAT